MSEKHEWYPFEKDGEKTFMRFDQIRIDRVDNHFEAIFMLMGKPVFTLVSPDEHFDAKDCLVLSGIEGRMEYQSTGD